jgi:hypothetical protein
MQEVSTSESSVQSIPEDFSAYQQWRETGEQPAAQDEKETPATTSEQEESEAAADSGTAEDTEQEEAQPPKKKGGFQRRIDELTKANRELERRLAESAVKPAETPKPAESAPTGEPQAKDFDTYEGYVRALTIYLDQEREAKKADDARKKANDEKAVEIANTWQSRSDEVRKQHADFDDVMEAGENLPISAAMRDFLIESDRGPELAYTLAKKPGEVERIAKLSPIAAARELARIELSLAPKSEAPKPKPRVTQTPEPIRPVGRTSAAAKKPLVEEDDFSAYEKRRRAGER